jgi:hypothetical protein
MTKRERVEAVYGLHLADRIPYVPGSVEPIADVAQGGVDFEKEPATRSR